MGVAKRDLSGYFDADLKGIRSRRATVLDNLFHVDRRGIAFVTDVALTEWIEVNVKMQMPTISFKRQRAISCRAAVVQCTRREGNKGFEVVLLFLDLPKRDEAHLGLIQPKINPASISIYR